MPGAGNPGERHGVAACGAGRAANPAPDRLAAREVQEMMPLVIPGTAAIVLVVYCLMYGVAVLFDFRGIP